MKTVFPVFRKKPSAQKPPVSKQQVRHFCAETGMTVTSLARESGLQRQAVSMYKNQGIGLTNEQLQALRKCMEQYVEFEVEGFDEAEAVSVAGTLEKPAACPIGAAPARAFPAPQVVVVPAASLDEDEVDLLSERLDEVVARIGVILETSLVHESGVLCLLDCEGYSAESRAEHDELVALLAEEALLRRRLEGRDIAPPLSPQLQEKGALMNTHGELLAQRFPHPGTEDFAGSVATAAGDASQQPTHAPSETETSSAPKRKPSFLLDL